MTEEDEQVYLGVVQEVKSHPRHAMDLFIYDWERYYKTIGKRFLGHMRQDDASGALIAMEAFMAGCYFGQSSALSFSEEKQDEKDC